MQTAGLGVVCDGLRLYPKLGATRIEWFVVDGQFGALHQ